MAELVRIDSADDRRVVCYRDLKDRELATMPGGVFIAEGEQLVRRLLASSLKTESVLLAARRAEEIAPLVPENVSVYVGPDEIVNAIIGFKFHSGVMAIGRRPKAIALESLLEPRGKPRTFLICPEIANTENLGGLIRIAAAFGCDAMILGERSCDPFFRQCVRVSMGTVFKLPIVRSANLLADLKLLRASGVELLASVLDESAEGLSDAQRSSRCAILFGNEAQGLTADEIASCDRRVTIPMKLGTDSLNVAVAAGVMLYHFTR